MRKRTLFSTPLKTSQGLSCKSRVRAPATPYHNKAFDSYKPRSSLHKYDQTSQPRSFTGVGVGYTQLWIFDIKLSADVLVVLRATDEGSNRCAKVFQVGIKVEAGLKLETGGGGTVLTHATQFRSTPFDNGRSLHISTSTLYQHLSRIPFVRLI